MSLFPTIQQMIAAACTALVAFPALATGEIEALITQADRERLARYETVRAEALAEARAGGTPQDVAKLDAALAAGVPFTDADLRGEWRCRTIKAGGLAKLVVYGWFRCRITDDGSGYRLEKLTGSQRTAGRFFTDSDERMTYLGAFHVAGDPAPAYGTGPESDQVGYAFRMGEDAWRIEFPAPYYESKLDILEFQR
jgi:hypothetical protein